jgi:hypothetical protein
MISGACFTLSSGSLNVTSLFDQDTSNSANIIPGTTVQVLSPSQIDAHFNFTSANAGKTFLIFVTGPNGTSQNLTALPAGTACPAGFIGNQGGFQVTFKCNATAGGGGSGGTPQDIAKLTSCALHRKASGTIFIDLFGSNIAQGATVTANNKPLPGKTRVQFADLDTGTNRFTRIRLIKGVCSFAPATFVVLNPGANGAPSQPFICAEACPNQ